MGPAKTTPKPKHVYQPPSWIDIEHVKKLPKDKQEYWANRIKGGAPKPELSKLFKAPDNIVIGFDNEGKMVAKTRAYRRKKLPTDNIHTKSTHSIQKARKKK